MRHNVRDQPMNLMLTEARSMASFPRITEENAGSRKVSGLSTASGRRGSASSLKRGTTGLTGAYIPPFNFEAAKAKVERCFAATVPGRFTEYFKTSRFDKIARACLQHFLAVVEQQAISTALHRATRQQTENVNMLMVSAHQESLAKEEQEQLAQIGPLYALVILEQSSFTQPGMQSRPHREDNLFFQALYKAIADIIQEGFLRHPYSDIETHLGSLFRTSWFNIAGHRQEVPQLVDVVPLPDLVELRQGMSRKDPIAASKLNALNSRTQCINYRIASQANTNIVASLLRPSQTTSSRLNWQSSLLMQDSTAVLSVPAAILDPLEPAENTAVSTDRFSASRLRWWEKYMQSSVQKPERSRLSKPLGVNNAARREHDALAVVDMAGMIIDAQLKQLRLLRSILTRRNPSAEGQNSRQGSTMRNLSMLRGSLRPQASSLSMSQL